MAMHVAQFPDQFQHLGLGGHIQRCGRLIGDQQFRAHRQRHRDHHALALPAGKLMRVAFQDAVGFGQMHCLDQTPRLAGAIRLRHIGMEDKDLFDLARDREGGFSEAIGS